MARHAHKAGRFGTFAMAAACAGPALTDGLTPADAEVSHAC